MAVYGNPLGNGLGTARQVYLDKMLLENISQNTVYDRYADITKPLPLKNSKQVQFEKWIPVKQYYFEDSANRAFTGNDEQLGEETLINVARDKYKAFMLDEGSSGTSKAKMKLIKKTATVFPIGDWLPYSEELELFHDRWKISEVVSQMAEGAGLVIDGFYRDLYYYGAGHIYDISGDGSGNDNVTDPAFKTAIRKLVTAMKLSGAEGVSQILSSSPNYGTVPVNGRFVAYGHTTAIDALEDNPDWIPVEKYASGVKVLPNERGMLDKIRFIEEPNAYIENVGTDEYIAEFTVFGKKHTAQVPLRGKGKHEVVHKQLGSGGISDPLNRVATIGWKSWIGATVLYPERLGILKAKYNY